MSNASQLLEAQRRALLSWLVNRDNQPLLASLQSLSQASELPPSIRSFAFACRAHLDKDVSTEHPGPWAVVFGRLDRWIKQCIEDPSAASALEGDIQHALDQLGRWADQGHRFWVHNLMPTHPEVDKQGPA